MVDIVITNTGAVAPADGKASVTVQKRPPAKERRRNRRDRRKSAREGIFVSLSMKKDRRSRPDRRAK